MKTLISNLNSPQSLTLSVKQVARTAVRKIVTVTTGAAQFGIDTRLIQNVVQVSDVVFAGSDQAIMIGDEKISVVSLNVLIANVLIDNVLIDDASNTLNSETNIGNTLLIIRSPTSQKSLAIRVDSVSRPVEVDNANFYRLPNCIYGNRQNEFVESLAMMRSGNSQADEVELRLIINPLKPYELDDQQAQIEKFAGHLDKTTAVVDAAKGQMVVFAPAGVGNNLDFQLCLPLPLIAEIIQTDEDSMLPLPIPLPKLTGMVMWRGIPVPVIDLAGQFKLDRVVNEKSGSRLVVCHLGQGQHVAFYTQVQIKTLRTPESTPAEMACLSDVPKLAAVNTEYGVIVVPDLKAILNR